MAEALERLTASLSDRYRIERELGAGGMATVYLAQDLRHDRKVALKVLRPELAAVIGAERFLQEIKTTANLQHPHILALFDSGELTTTAATPGDSTRTVFYVMPYVEGESLRDRLTREKQLPIDTAIRIATEVASALDYAHRHGVIHRDIKPENILLHDGTALVADFGIALAASSAGGARMTESGMSLGTPRYMSPEQAMGERELTARSDVYALGCVLYEMLSGEPPFTGPTAQAIVARVMTGEPAPLRAERKTIPAHVEAAVLQALEKLPADRFDSAAEFAAALENSAFTTARTGAGPAAGMPERARVWLPWALLVAALGVMAYDWLRTPPSTRPEAVQRFSIRLPVHAAWVDEDGSGMSLSPDGTLLAYTGSDSTGRRHLFLRPMDQLDPVPVPGGAEGGLPFFSPDGQSVGFIGNSGLHRSLVAGGRPEFVCPSRGYVNATWLERNDIIFGDGSTQGLQQCAPDGTVTTLLASDSAESFNLPHGLPGDRGVLFTIRRGSTERLAVLDLQTGAANTLDIVGTDPRYVETGHLVYMSPDGLLRAVGFHLRTLTTSGESQVIAEGVSVGRGGRAQLAMSRGGILVTVGGTTAERALELVDRSGRSERLFPRLARFGDPRFSPDGRRIVVSVGSDIWMADPAQGTLTLLSADSLASRPVWSPDGRRVAYVRQTGARVTLRIVNADGSAPAESLLALPDLSLWEGLFTPDRRSLVVRTVGGATNRDLWWMLRDSVQRPMALLRSPADEVSPALSPDGRWMAYASNESGRYEISVRPFPGMGARYPVSLAGGTEPVWSPRSDELFYRAGPTLMAAEIRAGTTFEIGRRVALFSNDDFQTDPTHAGYDVAPDGRHFVMVRRLGGTSVLTVTLNQLQNLERGSGAAAPAGRAR